MVSVTVFGPVMAVLDALAFATLATRATIVSGLDTVPR